MLSILDVLNYFEELNSSDDLGFENFYCGKLDNKKEKALGFYDLKNSNPYILPIGGISEKTVNELYVSILIHFTNDYIETEQSSYNLYNKIIELCEMKDIIINDYNICYFQLLSGNEDVGTDDNGIYERVIQFKIEYKNKK